MWITLLDGVFSLLKAEDEYFHDIPRFLVLQKRFSFDRETSQSFEQNTRIRNANPLHGNLYPGTESYSSVFHTSKHQSWVSFRLDTSDINVGSRLFTSFLSSATWPSSCNSSGLAHVDSCVSGSSPV